MNTNENPKPVEAAKAPEKQSLHYFLFSTRVVYVRDKVERGRDLNVLIAGQKGFISRADLDRVQMQAQARFFNEFDQKRETKVVDVYIASVSYLGFMTEEQFHEGFDQTDAPKEDAKPEPEGVPADRPVKESN